MTETDHSLGQELSRGTASNERGSATNNIGSLLGLITPFNAEDPFVSPEQFIDSFEAIAELAKWTDAERLIVFRNRLRGKALEFLAADPDSRKESNYVNFKRNFLDYFEKEVPLAMKLQNFSACKQKPNETVKQFAGRIKCAAHEYLQNADTSVPAVASLADQTRLSQFLSGLNPRIQRATLSHNPDTFQMAVKYANLEEINDSMFSKGSTIHNTQAEGKGYELLADIILKQANEHKREMAELKETIINYTSGAETQSFARQTLGGEIPYQGENRVCFYCGLQGHLMKACRRRQAAQNAGGPTQYRRDSHFHNQRGSYFPNQRGNFRQNTRQGMNRDDYREESPNVPRTNGSQMIEGYPKRGHDWQNEGNRGRADFHRGSGFTGNDNRRFSGGQIYRSNLN